MINILSKINSPKNVFFIDAIGAFFSAFVLFFIHEIINGDFYNIPDHVITFLYTTAGIYMLYSFTCYMLVKNQWKKFLSILIALNILYSLMTLIVLFLFNHQITVFGLSYFIIELCIIAFIIRFEFLALKFFKT